MKHVVMVFFLCLSNKEQWISPDYFAFSVKFISIWYAESIHFVFFFCPINYMPLNLLTNQWSFENNFTVIIYKWSSKCIFLIWIPVLIPKMYTAFCLIPNEQFFKYIIARFGLVWFMVLNTTFNNISVISCLSVLWKAETEVPGKNLRPVISN